MLNKITGFQKNLHSAGGCSHWLTMHDFSFDLHVLENYLNDTSQR